MPSPAIDFTSTIEWISMGASKQADLQAVVTTTKFQVSPAELPPTPITNQLSAFRNSPTYPCEAPPASARTSLPPLKRKRFRTGKCSVMSKRLFPL
jgi:hypothetical protein